MPALPSFDCKNGRRFMQSHGVCRLWLRILLVMHERDKWSTLFEVRIIWNNCLCCHSWKNRRKKSNQTYSICYSPSGCTFWGKKPWSRKKKLLWQLGTLVGAPVGIALVAGIAVPAMIIGEQKNEERTKKNKPLNGLCWIHIDRYTRLDWPKITY